MKKTKYLILAFAAFAMTLACVSCKEGKTIEYTKEKKELTTTDLSRLYGDTLNLFVHIEKKGGTSGDAVLYDKARVVNGEIEGPTKYIDQNADSYTFYAWADCSGKEHEVDILNGGMRFKGVTQDDAQKIFVSAERNVQTKEFLSIMQEGLNKHLIFESLSKAKDDDKSGISVKETENDGYVINFK